MGVVDVFEVLLVLLGGGLFVWEFGWFCFVYDVVDVKYDGGDVVFVCVVVGVLEWLEEEGGWGVVVDFCFVVFGGLGGWGRYEGVLFDIVGEDGI